MKKAWETFERMYQDKPIVLYSCAAHVLMLLINDIFKLDTTTVLIINNCKSIVKDVKCKFILPATFLNIQKEER